MPFCVCQKEAKLKNINRKALIPAAEEIEANPRARSAKFARGWESFKMAQSAQSVGTRVIPGFPGSKGNFFRD